jgi:cation diffusion facilitator CzcD-associated flavoprotein CzcO
MWGVETAEEFLAIAGFGQIETCRLPHDPIKAYFFAHRFARLPGSQAIRDRDTYLPRDSVAEYLTEYAERLDAPIHFGTQVLAVRRDGDGWHIETNNGDFRSAHVIVATGWERLKTMPIWPGMDEFGGQVIHAADLSDPCDYDGKKVLVIGARNSSTDVLNHLARKKPLRCGSLYVTAPRFFHRVSSVFRCTG